MYVSGTLQTRRWCKDGEESDRSSTEIRLAPGGRVQFLDRPNGANGSAVPAASTEAPGASASCDPHRHKPLIQWFYYTQN